MRTQALQSQNIGNYFSENGQQVSGTSVGETITVTYEESKKLRKEGWRPRNDVVVMTYVGKPENVLSNRTLATRNWPSWAPKKLAEAAH